MTDKNIKETNSPILLTLNSPFSDNFWSAEANSSQPECHRQQLPNDSRPFDCFVIGPSIVQPCETLFPLINSQGAIDNGSRPRCLYNQRRFENIGNSCYMNAALQIVFSLPEFVTRLKRMKSNRSFYKNCKHLIKKICDLGTRMECLASAEDSGHFGPHYLRNMLKQIRNSLGHDLAPQFGSKEQQDAHHFYVKLLELFDNSVYLHNAFGESNTALQSPNTLFKWEVLHRIECANCHFMHPTRAVSVYEILIGLSYGIDSNSDISDLLKLHFATELVEYKCTKCSSQNARKHQYINNYPLYLMVVLKRYSQSVKTQAHKINNVVQVNQQIVFDNQDVFEMRSTENNNGPSYSLVSYINHHGDCIHSGHYTATTFDQCSGKWLHCDDDDISEIELHEALPAAGKSAYMVVYKMNY